MPAHRIGLSGTRHAFAEDCGPQLSVPGKRVGMKVPNGLAVPSFPKGRLVSGPAASLAKSGGCGPPTDPPGARPRAGPDCTTNL
jgi:hypothetical protein